MSECPENLLHILQILKKEFKESNEISDVMVIMSRINVHINL